MYNVVFTGDLTMAENEYIWKSGFSGENPFERSLWLISQGRQYGQRAKDCGSASYRLSVVGYWTGWRLFVVGLVSSY
jgi:hypothetical protein